MSAAASFIANAHNELLLKKISEAIGAAAPTAGPLLFLWIRHWQPCAHIADRVENCPSACVRGDTLQHNIGVGVAKRRFYAVARHVLVYSNERSRYLAGFALSVVAHALRSAVLRLRKLFII